MANVAATVANVNMVTALVKLDEVDAGFVYVSDYRAANLGLRKLAVIDRPIAAKYQSNPLPTYPIGIVKTSKHITMARDFTHFVMSAQGQKILVRYGFQRMPYPKITAALSPATGTAGSAVTITGTNFYTTGTVKFTDVGGTATTATITTWGRLRSRRPSRRALRRAPTRSP